MNVLLRLYPSAWRDRYLSEMSDLLAERRPTFRDQLDLIAGAVDAWMHPQVTARPREESDPILRPIAVYALFVIGGALWIAGGAVQATAPYGVEGYKESTGVMLIIAGSLVTALGSIGRAWFAGMSRPYRRCASAMLAFALLILTPWPILALGFYGYVFATLAFGLLLAESGKLAGLLLALAAIVATSFNTETTMAFAAVPLGLAWIGVGLSGALRRAPAAAPAGT
jgi:nitrate reductase NapE component